MQEQLVDRDTPTKLKNKILNGERFNHEKNIVNLEKYKNHYYKGKRINTSYTCKLLGLLNFPSLLVIGFGNLREKNSCNRHV